MMGGWEGGWQGAFTSPRELEALRLEFQKREREKQTAERDRHAHTRKQLEINYRAALHVVACNRAVLALSAVAVLAVHM